MRCLKFLILEVLKCIVFSHLLIQVINFWGSWKDDLRSHRPILVIPAYVHTGSFVLGFQSGIACELITAQIWAVKCSSCALTQMLFSPSCPEILFEDTLTVVKLESSEEKSFKWSWLDTENLFFAAVEMNIEPNSTGLQLQKMKQRRRQPEC